MDPATGAIIAAGIQGGASLLGGLFGRSGQDAANAQNIQQAERQRDFQLQMSNTAYQRGMADMKAAGLNPILAGNLGGASTASGAMPVIGNAGASMQQAMEGISHSAGSVFDHQAKATQAIKDTTQSSLNEASVALQHQLANKAEVDTMTSAAQAQQLLAQTKNIDQNTINAQVEQLILGHGVNTAEAAARLKGTEADYAAKWGPGTAGQIGGTGERLLGRIADFFKISGPSGSPKLTPPPFVSPTFLHDSLKKLGIGK